MKQLNILSPQLSVREKYIADLLRFAAGIDSLELNKLPTDDLKFLAMGFRKLMKLKKISTNECE